MTTNRSTRVYTARIPYVLDDTTLNGLAGVILAQPSVLEVVRCDDPPHSSHDDYAFIVTTTNPSALVRDICRAFHDEPTDESRVSFLD